MSDSTAYLTQVLVAIAKACRPHSPVKGRDWADIRWAKGIPSFKAATSALARSGLIHRRGLFAKPSPLGYELVARWREAEAARRRRPPLWAQVLRDPESAFDGIGDKSP